MKDKEFELLEEFVKQGGEILNEISDPSRTFTYNKLYCKCGNLICIIRDNKNNCKKEIIVDNLILKMDYLWGVCRRCDVNFYWSRLGGLEFWE